MVTRTLSLIILTASTQACVQQGIEDERVLPEVDNHYFRCEVQPELVRSCAFMDCHGNEERSFRIYAEQRLRRDVDWLDYEAPLSAEELADNLQAVRGFIGDQSGQQDLLSEKPLDVRAGGLYHGARDLYGPGDVFLGPEDPGYLRLRALIEGVTAAPNCIPSTGTPL